MNQDHMQTSARWFLFKLLICHEAILKVFNRKGHKGFHKVTQR